MTSRLTIRVLASVGFELLRCRCDGQNNGFIPKLQTKVKTFSALTEESPTELPAVERELWGLRLWQVVGLFLVGTIVVVIFSCCICDCRIPKRMQFGNEEKQEDDDDEEEVENQDNSVVSMSTRSFPSTLPRRQNSSSSFGSHSEVDFDSKTNSWQTLKTMIAASNALHHIETPSSAISTTNETAQSNDQLISKTSAETNAKRERFEFSDTRTTNALANGSLLPSSKAKNSLGHFKTINGKSCAPQITGRDNNGLEIN